MLELGQGAAPAGDLIKDGTEATMEAFDPLGFTRDPITKKLTPNLVTAFEYRLDGVILSNEEPYSFAPTGERDATIFTWENAR